MLSSTRSVLCRRRRRRSLFSFFTKCLLFPKHLVTINRVCVVLLIVLQTIAFYDLSSSEAILGGRRISNIVRLSK